MALSYKCGSVGCYSYKSPETNTLFQRLQSTVNQFANALAFSPLKVDGIIGKGTTEATLVVLLYIAELDSGVLGGSARALEAGINTPEQLANGAQAVLDTLTLATKTPPPPLVGQIGPTTPLPSPTPAPSATQIATTTANSPTKASSAVTADLIKQVKLKNPALATSLLDVVPPWVAYVGGAALAVGAIAAAVVASKRRKASAGAAPAVAGWYR